MRLDRNKFEAWLKAKQPGDIVGNNRDCDACPIANFYLDAAGSEIAIFGDGARYIIDRGYDRREPPGWAAEFITAVDCDGASAHVTAQRALEILTAIDRPRQHARS